MSQYDDESTEEAVSAVPLFTSELKLNLFLESIAGRGGRFALKLASPNVFLSFLEYLKQQGAQLVALDPVAPELGTPILAESIDELLQAHRNT